MRVSRQSDSGGRVNLSTVALIAVGGYLIYDRRTTTRQPPAATTELQASALPIREALGDNSVKRGAIAQFYLQFADIIRRDGIGDQAVDRLSVFRTAHERALVIAFRETDIAAGAKVGSLIDAVIEKAVGGREDQEVTAEIRVKLIKALEAIAKGPTQDRGDICGRWGCILPVGPGSEFGPGPVCMVGEQGLRPSPVPPESVRLAAVALIEAARKEVKS